MMNQNPFSSSMIISDLVLIGGGHAHVHLLKMYGMSPYRSILLSHGIQCTLITSDILTPYSGMLPGMVAGHYSEDEIHIDLQRLCSFSGFRFIHASATGIVMNTEMGRGGWIDCSDGRPPVRFDVLSINVGSSPSLPSSGWISPPDWTNIHTNTYSYGAVIPVKPIAGFSKRWKDICSKLQTILQEQLLQINHQEKDFHGSSNNPPLAITSSSSRSLFSRDEPYILAIIGGGAGGIELALATHHALRKLVQKVSNSLDVDIIKVILVTRGHTLLESHNVTVQTIFQRILHERNIEVRYNSEALGVEDYIPACGLKKLQLANSQQEQTDPILFHDCLWCTSAGAPSWIARNTPLETDSDGFIKVNTSYESINIQGIFAAGDCCHMVKNPRPKAGVFAVRAGPILKENLISYLLQQPLTTHTPQQEFLGLISTGDKYAVASRGQHALEGAFLWDLKDQIDRSFMNGFAHLPSMDSINDSESRTATITPPNLKIHGIEALMAFASSPMRCGGCGSKVGSSTLSRVLNSVYNRRRQKRHEKGIPVDQDLIQLDDAAVIMLPVNRGVSGHEAMIQTIDFFRSFITDPFVFGKIAAVHAMSDCHAMGCLPDTALALAVCPYSAVEVITESTLVDMLSGASDALEADGCSLSGGHTCEGAELGLGFAVSSYVPDSFLLLRKSGGRVGDKIVLTKPLGTGSIFAANMRYKSKGPFVSEAIEMMTCSNGPASQVAVNIVERRKTMSDAGIHACTDVTGFGLIGHLLEMLLANDSVEGLASIGATLHVEAIPVLSGAVDATANNIFSTLYKDNLRNRRAIRNHEMAMETSPLKYPLLFDPQTSGGLLFFVSPEVCEGFVKELLDIPGYHYTSVIGAIDACENKSNLRIIVV